MPREWHTKSGTIKTECPKCNDAGAVDPLCDVCKGTNELGMGESIKWILANPRDTDPAPPTDPAEDTKK